MVLQRGNILGGLVFISVLAGCSQVTTAPVVSVGPVVAAPSVPPPYVLYTVKSGDSLSVIASRYHLPFTKLAQINNLSVPYNIFVGQTLKVPNPQLLKTQVKQESLQYGGVATALTQQNSIPAQNLKFAPVAVPVSNPSVTTSATTDNNVSTNPSSDTALLPSSAAPVKMTSPSVAKPSGPVSLPHVSPTASLLTDDVTWSWPVAGQVTGRFGQGAGLMSKGIEIATAANAKIGAAAMGSVSFSGTGVNGYGKMIIVKSENNFLTVYTNLSSLLVKDGQKVVRGTPVGVVGLINGLPVLHFEIRNFGNPVDPLDYLPPTGN